MYSGLANAAVKVSLERCARGLYQDSSIVHSAYCMVHSAVISSEQGGIAWQVHGRVVG